MPPTDLSGWGIKIIDFDYIYMYFNLAYCLWMYRKAQFLIFWFSFLKWLLWKSPCSNILSNQHFFARCCYNIISFLWFIQITVTTVFSINLASSTKFFFSAWGKYICRCTRIKPRGRLFRGSIFPDIALAIGDKMTGFRPRGWVARPVAGTVIKKI